MLVCINKMHFEILILKTIQTKIDINNIIFVNVKNKKYEFKTGSRR
jgi:hypothetical protein